MRYTWPKFKLCRREWVNLFWVPKYDIRKRRKLPWQHWDTMPRLSEYGKLLRNKQILRRMYSLTEKKFMKLVTTEAWKFGKNKWVAHDQAVVQFLERRLDSIMLRAWFGKTIMQTRQEVTHWHFQLNGKKHNIPSYYVQIWDKIKLKEKLKSSPQYSTSIPINMQNFKAPSWIKINKSSYEIEILDLPKIEDINVPVDVLKVIEYYARA